MTNYMKLEIAAISENESFARSAVAAFALALNPTLGELSDIKTAVSEAVTNCIVHAYAGGDVARRVYIECTAKKIADQGELKLLEMDVLNDLFEKEYEKASPELLHSKVGAYIAKDRYGIEDQEILEAID